MHISTISFESLEKKLEIEKQVKWIVSNSVEIKDANCEMPLNSNRG